jgi:hypothetical protein
MSQLVEYYDLDDVLPSQSPQLVPVKPNYRFDETPPPFVPEETSSSSCSPEPVKGGATATVQDGGTSGARRRTKKRKGRTAPSFTDIVLIGVHENDRATLPKQVLPEPRLVPLKTTLDLKPPPRIPHSLPPINTEKAKLSLNRICGDEDSIARSPNLAKLTITSAEGNPDNTLPAIQISPPRSSSAHPPESIPTLPSLQIALNMDSTGSGSTTFSIPGHSPTKTRPSPSHISQFGPSPSSYSQPSPYMPPPGLANYPSDWRTGPREGPVSTPSDHQSTPTSPTDMIPPSTISYTPSVATVAEHDPNRLRQDSLDESTSTTSPQAQRQSIDGPVHQNGPLATNAFKCSYQGCNAMPFQTQYLLNSHANVHSSSRPYFCPVQDCPRGQGGRGFKRKNEMIR